MFQTTVTVVKSVLQTGVPRYQDNAEPCSAQSRSALRTLKRHTRHVLRRPCGPDALRVRSLWHLPHPLPHRPEMGRADQPSPDRTPRATQVRRHMSPGTGAAAAKAHAGSPILSGDYSRPLVPKHRRPQQHNSIDRSSARQWLAGSGHSAKDQPARSARD